MQKIITICVVILTIIISTGAVILANDRYRPIDAILEWNKERVARNERHKLFQYQYDGAIKLVGAEKAGFVKRFCSLMYIDSGNIDSDGEGWAYNGCITNVAEKMAENCSSAFRVYGSTRDMWSQYMNEKKRGTISFSCE